MPVQVVIFLALFIVIAFLSRRTLLPLTFGLRQLSSRGGAAEGRRTDPAFFGLEKSAALVTSGVYKYIEHPLHSSLLFAVSGIFFKAVDFRGGTGPRRETPPRADGPGRREGVSCLLR